MPTPNKPGFNGTRQIIDLAAAGALTDILATGPVKYILVKESQLTSAGAANVPQGFEYKLPNDGFTQLLETIPNDVLEIGDISARFNRDGSILGNGPSYIQGSPTGVTPATVLFKAQSAGATATSIEVSQFYS